MNIGIKEARRLLDALDHLRRALDIAQAARLDQVRQLAMERCIEIADEALQTESSYATAKIEDALMLKLSKLRYLLGRDYHIVDPVAVRSTVLEVFPELIRKIESSERKLQRAAKLVPLPKKGSR